MRITIYRIKEYESIDFHAHKADKIREACYNMNIKWYTISYTDKEYEEYERFSIKSMN